MDQIGRRSRIGWALARLGLLVMGPWLLSACVSAPERADRQEQAESVADILSEPLAAEDYDPPRRCISEASYRDFRPIGDRFLVFEGPGDTLWLNELRGRCPGLDRTSTLVFRTRGFQMCEFDQFQLSDWFTWSRYQRWPWRWPEGIPCTLGRFQRVNEAQVEALKAAVR